MNFLIESYERNKKYAVAFLALASCIAIIYTKWFIDFPKIGVLCVISFSLLIFFLPKKNIGTLRPKIKYL